MLKLVTMLTIGTEQLTDLYREFAQNFTRNRNMPYIKMSTKTRQGVEVAFFQSVQKNETCK